MGQGQRPRSVSRTNSTNSPAKRKPRKSNQDTLSPDGIANPDPAVFEAAFVLDDEDADPPLATTNVQTTPSDNAAKEGTVLDEKQNGDAKTQADAARDEKSKDALSSSPAELPSHIKAKLRKLEKLESTYPG